MKQINGDNPGNILNRLLYFFQCINNHKKGSDDSCEISNPYLTISSLETFDKTPSRLLCDGLWNSIDYGNLKLQLNSDLNFFDIGCGSGKYGKLLKKISNQLKKKINVNTCIIPLGGNNSFWTHLRYITLPDYFKKFILKDKAFKWCNQKNVDEKIIKSVNKELDCNEENPIFWAFIISSNKINIKDNLVKNFQSK